MPILDIEIVGPHSQQEQLAQRLADAAGVALDSRPQETWVKLRYLDAAAYAENGGAGDVLPVFIRLLLSAPPEGPELALQIAKLADAIAAVIGRPAENIHVLVEPPAKGRIAFGGRLQ